MRFRHLPALALVVTAATLWASDQPLSSAHLSKQTRLDLIRTFDAELVYIRTSFPMGQKGLTLKDGTITPNGQDLERLMAMWGPSVKPGDLARISDVKVKDDRIRFEVNGGPVRKKKWYQRIEVDGAGGAVPLNPSDSDANPRGTYVDLVFDHYVPELTPQQLKDLLSPVFDFNSKSRLEAYLDTVPPKAKEAIKAHHVLVGMNREMVTYAKGRPPKKDREKDESGVEYEEWIYGEPPQDVDFVRFVGDEVVRVETMKVDGEKTVRTEKEIELEQQPTVAKEADGEPAPRPANAPTMRRPGEAPDPSQSGQDGTIQQRVPMGPMPPPPPDNSPGGAPVPQYANFR
ncbi:MAG TPA: hypothetical protein VMH85_13485 [Terriglobales bacterium]|nr:hypothetical protein [Terriglobales bacterium]